MVHARSPPSNPTLGGGSGSARPGFATLVAELEWPRSCDIGLVALVDDAGLGVVNALRQCVAALEPIHPVIVLNRFEGGQELHRRDLAWLRHVDGFGPVAPSQAFTDRLLRLLDERR
ncbi:MAG: hypothetical protein ACYDGN_03705 [Acidimicrobiales bacterium]